MSRLEIGILLVLIGVAIVADNTRAIGIIALGYGSGMIVSLRHKVDKHDKWDV